MISLFIQIFVTFPWFSIQLNLAPATIFHNWCRKTMIYYLHFPTQQMYSENFMMYKNIP